LFPPKKNGPKRPFQGPPAYGKIPQTNKGGLAI